MKFSIIIPCYKVERYICQCIDSVLAQDYGEWEALCVDDGSPDGTGSILDRYAARDLRIKVIHQENRGLSEARNSALRIAKGEWLYYLDSDDVMPPNVLCKVAEVAKRNSDADLIRGTLTTFVNDEEIVWGESRDGYNRVDLSNRLLASNGYFQQFFYRRLSFGDIQFVGPHWSEEKLYFAKVAVKTNMLVEIYAPTYGFRYREGSITHSTMSEEQCAGFIDAMYDILVLSVKSGKKIDQRVLRGKWAMLMERSSCYIVERMEGPTRRRMWRHWFCVMRKAANIRPKPFWFAFVTTCCKIFPMRITACILCYLPNWLKRKGVHR